MTDRLAERDQLLAALWEIEMAAKRATVDEPVWALPNRIIVMAQAAMGKDRQRAQELAGVERRLSGAPFDSAPACLRPDPHECCLWPESAR